MADAGFEEAGQMQREEEAAATAKGEGELRLVRRDIRDAQEIDHRERVRDIETGVGRNI